MSYNYIRRKLDERREQHASELHLTLKLSTVE
jgi:hypothetical protein